MILILVALGFGTQASPAEEDLDLLEQQAFQAAVERVAPSVVRIDTVGGVDRVGKVPFGTGPTTGLVIDAEGYVVSSAVGFQNGSESILVRLPDGSHKPAELVATDHNRMIVLLKIETDSPLPVPDFVPEAEIRVGQWAIAVGRTFEGNRPNVAVGIVSALGRVWGKAVQTDAAVSPNNYGGPLVDLRGRVLGVLVPLSPQAATEVAGVEWYDSGIGFAVPAFHVQEILPKLKLGGDLHPGVIGISFSAGNLSTSEPVVAARHPNSPASEAGLKAGDRIVEIEGRPIVRASQAKAELSRRYAGETVRLIVLREKERIEHDLELVAKLEPYEHPFLGILPMRPPAGFEERAAGVTVRYVYPESPAAKAGIERGDVVVALAGEPVEEADAFRLKLSDHQPEDEVEFEVRRGEETLRLKALLGRLPEDLPPDALPPARQPDQLQGEPAAEPDPPEPPQAGPIQLKIPEFENNAWAYVPEDYDAAVRYGLVVWLHGPGGFDWNELLRRWKPHCDQADLILLAPKSADPDGWRPTEATLVRKMLDDVKSTYTLDPARIVVHGHQSGGKLAYLVGFRERDVVRAVAAVEAPVTGRPPQNDPVYRMAFYAAWAKKSRDADRLEAGVGGLRDRKYPVTVQTLGDEPRYLNPDELSELVRWIDTLDRI